MAGAGRGVPIWPTRRVESYDSPSGEGGVGGPGLVLPEEAGLDRRDVVVARLPEVRSVRDELDRRPARRHLHGRPGGGEGPLDVPVRENGVRAPAPSASYAH